MILRPPARNDLQTLKDNGLPVVFWGLQNEPFANVGYSSCAYTPAEYAQTFKVVAPVIRRFDPKIQIIADTDWSWKFRYIRPVLNDPATASMVDDLVIHHIGVDAKDDVPPIEPSGRPRFENEFEYLDGKTSPSRCLNTVEDIMNWFQLAHSPAWFWIHAPQAHGKRRGPRLRARVLAADQRRRPCERTAISRSPAGLLDVGTTTTGLPWAASLVTCRGTVKRWT